ncbi:MAG: hypothetical protein ACTSPV_05200 [Candidatus Hodarchaeales archaeon]
MRREKKVAYLIHQQLDEIDEYGKFVDTYSQVIRLSSPVIDGKKTGSRWFSPPVRTSLTAQEFADRYGEVVFDETTGEYVYPRKKRRAKCSKKEKRHIKSL